MSTRTARGTSLSTSSRNTVTWIPHDFKFNSEWTLLYISLSSLSVCSFLVSGFQATVRIHFRLNNMSTELSSMWNFKQDNSPSSTHSSYTYRANLDCLFLFWPHPWFHNCHTTTISNHHEAHTTADTFDALRNKFLIVIGHGWFQYDDTTAVSYIHNAPHWLEEKIKYITKFCTEILCQFVLYIASLSLPLYITTSSVLSN
jgi:hypothetical protein